VNSNTTRPLAKSALLGILLALIAASPAGATGAMAQASPEVPLTQVLITASPNPVHPGEVLRLQWLATGFHGTVTCNDNLGWLVNGPGSGTISKTAGVDFTDDFRWIVDCDDGDFFARGIEDVRYDPTPAVWADPSSVTIGYTTTLHWDARSPHAVQCFDNVPPNTPLPTSGQFSYGPLYIARLQSATFTWTVTCSYTGHPDGTSSVGITENLPSATAQGIPEAVYRVGGPSSRQHSGDHQGTSNINVGIIDIGVNPHPDLNLRRGTNESRGFIGATPETGCTPTNPNDYLDDPFHSHGTAVAGLVAAKDDNQWIVGLLPGAPVYSYKVNLTEPNPDTLKKEVVCALLWIQSNAPRPMVLNMSFGVYDSDPSVCRKPGTLNPTTDLLHQTICDLTIDPGLRFVTSAGNSDCDVDCFPGSDFASLVPATFGEMLTVTAMNAYDGFEGIRGNPWSPSSAWNSQSACNQPGPGHPPEHDFGLDDTYARYSHHAVSAEDQAHTLAMPGTCTVTTKPDGTWTYATGTSLAAPLAAGLIGLCQEAGPAPAGCAGRGQQSVIQKITGDAVAWNDAHVNYGFYGDPGTPVSGHFYGWLGCACSYP